MTMSNGTGDSGRPDGETPVAATPRSDHNPRATEEGDRGHSGSAGDWGFGPGWNATHSQPTGVAENPVLQKAAEEIADASRRAHEPHLGQPLNPHEQGP